MNIISKENETDDASKV